MACRYCGIHGGNYGTTAECLHALRADTQRLNARLADTHRRAVDAEPVNRAQSVSAECQVPVRGQISQC